MVLKEESGPCGTRCQIGFHPLLGRVAPVEDFLGAEQRDAHVRVCGWVSHDHVAAQIGVGVRGLHADMHFSQVDPSPGPIQFRYIRKNCIAGGVLNHGGRGRTTAFRNVEHDLRGDQLNVACENGHSDLQKFNYWETDEAAHTCINRKVMR